MQHGPRRGRALRTLLALKRPLSLPRATAAHQQHRSWCSPSLRLARAVCTRVEQVCKPSCCRLLSGMSLHESPSCWHLASHNWLVLEESGTEARKSRRDTGERPNQRACSRLTDRATVLDLSRPRPKRGSCEFPKISQPYRMQRGLRRGACAPKTDCN